MGWQPPIDLTTKFGAPLMYGKPEYYVFFAENIVWGENLVYVGFTPGIGPNGRVFQLRRENNDWVPKELTEEAGAPRAFFEVRAYVHYHEGTQHVVYLGLDNQGVLDNQVHELSADDSNEWQHNNLTTAAEGGAPLALTTPTGYQFRNLQHVVYQGTDSHIYELWYDSNGWHFNDLTHEPAVAIGPLTADVFGSTATQHIAYRGITGSPTIGGHIHQLHWDNTGTWRHSDLMNASNAPPPAEAAEAPRYYSFEDQETQHINYLGTDGHVHELWWNYDNGWHHEDLTSQTGAPLGGNPSGYVFKHEETQHVVYEGNEGHIHELWWDNSGWHHHDLTPEEPDALMAGGPPTGYSITAPGHTTQHVIYTTRFQHHVIELKWTP
jgi:hypothetical protein